MYLNFIAFVKRMIFLFIKSFKKKNYLKILEKKNVYLKIFIKDPNLISFISYPSLLLKKSYGCLAHFFCYAPVRYASHAYRRLLVRKKNATGHLAFLALPYGLRSHFFFFFFYLFFYGIILTGAKPA
jgi:hypothetical protein